MVAEPQAAESRDTEVPEGSPEGLGELIAAYRSHESRDGRHTVELGRAFLAFRHRHGWSAQQLGRAAGITPGTVHHLESLLTLAPELIAAIERGQLTFKEGRSLADLHNGMRGPDHERQREIAAMFLSGRVSSVYVEAVVWAAKADPQADIDTVLARAIDRVKQGKNPPKNILGAKKIPPLKPNVPTPTELKAKIISLAADLTKVQMQPYSQVEMMCVRSVTRILIDRLKAAGVYEGGVRAPVNGGKP